MFKCGIAELKAHQLIFEVNMTMGTQHVLLLLVSVHVSRIMYIDSIKYARKAASQLEGLLMLLACNVRFFSKAQTQFIRL
jgi:hypothetical protein